MPVTTDPSLPAITALPATTPRPWRWLAVVSVIGFLLVGGMLTSLTVYTTTMQVAFGWDEVRMGLGPVALLLGMSAGNLLTDGATRRWGIRRTFLAGVTLAAGAWFLCGFTQGIGWLLAACLVCGFGVGLGSIVPSISLIAAAFTAHRGLAMGIFIGTAALASSIMPVTTGVLIHAAGWRWAFWIIGAVAFVVCAALLPLLPARLAPTHAPAAHGDASMRQPRHRVGWSFAALLIALTASQISLNGVLFNVVAYLNKGGFSLPEAVRLYSMANFVSLPGLLIGGYVSDRVRPYVLLPIILLLEGIGTAALIGATSTSLGWLALGIFVLVWGGVSGLPAQAGSMHLAEIVPPTRYALLLGTLFTVSGIVGAGAPAMVGWLYDTTHDYAWPIALLAALSLLGAIAALFSRSAPVREATP